VLVLRRRNPASVSMAVNMPRVRSANSAEPRRTSPGETPVSKAAKYHILNIFRI
jgi:hypothetical protein